MKCSVCSSDIPQGARFCPGCGTVVPSPSSPSEYNPTVVATPQEDAPPPRPATNYGSDPYNAPPVQNSSPNPYQVPPTYNANAYAPPYTPPVYPQPTRNRTKTWLIVGGIIVLVLLILCSGTSYLFYKSIGDSVNSLKVNATATAQAFDQQFATDTSSDQPTPDTTTPTPTVQPAQDLVTPAANPPYAKGSLILNDPLRDNSKGYKWDESTLTSKTNSADISTCAFKAGAYHLSRSVIGGLVCDPEAPQFTLNNVAFEAKVTILSGDAAGVTVRFNQTTGKGYLFIIYTNGGYAIDAIDFNNPDTSQDYNKLRQGTSSVIHQGIGQTNLVAIVVNGNNIGAYVNDQYIDSVQDSTNTSGQIGIYGGSNAGPLEISATSARVWKL